VSRLTLEGGDKLVARRVLMNKEYSLGKYVPLAFDDITSLDYRTIQKIMRELDSEVLAITMKGAKEAVQEKIFRNMSKRAAAMLREDIEYMDAPAEEDIENARQHTLDIYQNFVADTFDETVAAYKNANVNSKEQPDNSHFVPNYP
jgi:Mg/Co/Ni transporter MgtE